MPAGERRDVQRRVVNLSAFARESDLRLLEVAVADLSSEGCRIIGPIDLEQATRLWLKIPGITPRPARIAWSKPGEAGCTFEEPLDAALVDQVAASTRPVIRGLRGVFGTRTAEACA